MAEVVTMRVWHPRLNEIIINERELGDWLAKGCTIERPTDAAPVAPVAPGADATAVVADVVAGGVVADVVTEPTATTDAPTTGATDKPKADKPKAGK